MTSAAIVLGTLGWFVAGLLFGGVLNGLADNLPLGDVPRGRNRAEALLLPRCDYCGGGRRRLGAVCSDHGDRLRASLGVDGPQPGRGWAAAHGCGAGGLGSLVGRGGWGGRRGSGVP